MAGNIEMVAGDWVYRAEGAANIVLSHGGDSAALKGKVLRIRKRQTKAHSSEEHSAPEEGTAHEDGADAAAPSGAAVEDVPARAVTKVLSSNEQLLWGAVAADMVGTGDVTDMLRKYTERVMAPRLGERLVELGVPLEVSREFLEQLAQQLKLERPEWRQKEGHVDLDNRTCTLVADLTLLSAPTVDLLSAGAGGTACPPGEDTAPVVCVEIKPKCGFLSESQLLRSSSQSLKGRWSRFRMHQSLKLEKGQIDALSGYDPLDLFSEDPARMDAALDALLQCPQNNLRVFLDGAQVFGSGAFASEQAQASTSSPVQLGSVLGPALGSTADASLAVLKGVVVAALQDSQALSRLLQVQKLDSLDVEGILPVYRRFTSGAEVLEPDERITPEAQAFADALTLEECAQHLRDFLVAATAKDCGLMIAARRCSGAKEGGPGSSFPTVTAEGKTFEYRVTFIDLDLKHLEKIPKYHDLDQRILAAFSKHHTDDAPEP